MWLYRWCINVLLSYFLFMSSGLAQQVTLSGYVREAGTGESLMGISIHLMGTRLGTITNSFGFYSLTLPANRAHELVVRSVGYQSINQTITLSDDQEITFVLHPQSTHLNEVIVTGKTGSIGPEDDRMSIVSVPIRQLKQMPMLLGEKDIFKAFQLMPGVQKGREGTAGLYVRGGGPDQNLILLDDATVYNANHLFGFLSVFNGDALRQVELTKGGFPARFGGRLSSVVEMQMKDGNREEFHGEGGVGLISSRLTLEGPLRRDKLQPHSGSFLISGRRSYVDALLRPLSGGSFPKAYFYDLNAKVNYDFNPKNRLFLSSYFGRDVFSFTDRSGNSKREDGFNWGNATATLRYNHLLSAKFFTNSTLIFSHYDFTVFNQQADNNGFYSLQYASGIRDFTAKIDADYFPNPSHSLKFGGQITAHRFTPNALVLKDTRADTSGIRSIPIDATETGFYLEDTYRPTAPLSFNGGLRLSSFKVKSKTYLNLEPRLTARVQLTRQWALKASYARMNQYVQLLSNSGLGLPTDLWVPATEQIPPQRSDQLAFGINKEIPDRKLTLSAEVYYKRMSHLIGYREGASFLLLDFGPDANRTSTVDYQNNVTIGRGRSYGLELLAQRKMGRLSGWVGYTLSWIRYQFMDINKGQEFYPRYDRRHDLSVVGIYQLRPRIIVSSTFVYGTGNALTIPVGRTDLSDHTFTTDGSFTTVVQYGQTNAFRAAPYHRLDLAIQFRKPKVWGERVWEISIYNAYNRVNPFYYETRSSGLPAANGQVESKLYRRGLFPVLPSVSYSFKF